MYEQRTQGRHMGMYGHARVTGYLLHNKYTVTVTVTVTQMVVVYRSQKTYSSNTRSPHCECAVMLIVT
jgi:hypothetical protein